MRRLYLHVYFAILGILVVFAILVAMVWHSREGDAQDQATLEGAAVLLAGLGARGCRPRGPAGGPARAGLDRPPEPHALQPRRSMIASVGDRLPFPGARARSGWMPTRGGPVGVLRLPDGRWLVARQGRRLVHANVALILALLAVAVGIRAYPVARRLTRRLERLRTGVENLGAGDLKARVRVEGRDEVADLATSFNRAADRIESVVGAQRTLLASASHELALAIGADSRGSGADEGPSVLICATA